jgi:eukaryotic-like serine/threonine-protein kinase
MNWRTRFRELFAMSVETIFAAAAQKLTAERGAYLDEACGNDADLRQKVERLLKAHDVAGDFLESPAQRPADTINYAPIAEQVGSKIGPYILREQIGEGGFGLVFVAEQQEPVKRKVALKVIKPGMDSAQVIARFEAERQALALMDHPNIAKVLDAGATDTGRPYFVMELVRGIPITEYCDQNQLSPRERLDLFVTVCQAIQHAHQKGIIHRDIKPSNVLVTSHDGKPVAKVIDFGVAKAIHQHLTERTIYTNFAQMVGTPLYMSPEQAEMSGLDIDTRSDLYSLGVLLYELLTGTTPFDKKQLREAAYDEIRRLIREVEPPKPSTRLSQSTESLPSVAAQRRMEPAKLSKLVRGDLDWITMKALEKDRTRRYETANALARDIQRYLSDEPVEACPPSASYRLRKFARKNRAMLTTAATIAMLLVAGIAVSAWQAVRATQAERAAQAARIEETEQRRIAEEQRQTADTARNEAEIQRAQAEANFQKARKAVDEYFTLVSENKLLDVPGLQPLRRELLESALRFYDGFAHERTHDPAVLADVAVTYMRLAVTCHSIDRQDDAIRALDHALNVIDRLRREFPNSQEQQRGFAGFWKGLRRPMGAFGSLPQDSELATSTLSRLASTFERFAGEFPSIIGFQSDLAAIYFFIGKELDSLGKQAEALDSYRKSRAISVALIRQVPAAPEYRAGLARTLEEMADVLNQSKQPEEAKICATESLEIRKRLVDEAPTNAQYRNDLGDSFTQRGQLTRAIAPASAEADFRRALEIYDRLKAEYPGVANWGGLARAHALNGISLLLVSDPLRISEAKELHRQELAAWTNLAPAWVDGPRFATMQKIESQRAWAFRLREVGELAGTIQALKLAISMLDEVLASDPNNLSFHDQRHFDLVSLGVALLRLQHYSESEAAFRRVIDSESKLAIQRPEKPHLSAGVAGNLVNLATLLAATNRATEAEPLFRQAIAMQEKLVAEFPRGEYQKRLPSFHGLFANALFDSGRTSDGIAESERAMELAPDDAGALNNLAWKLSTAPEAGLRDPVRAVPLARRATELDSKAWTKWNTLGVVLYRSGQWQEAIEALHRSQSLATMIRVSQNGYVLAMCYSKQNQKEMAEKWFRASDAWTAAYDNKTRSCLQFRDEAAQILGLNLDPLVKTPMSSESARDICQLIRKFDAQAAWTHDWLAPILVRDANYADAFREMRDAERIDPDPKKEREVGIAVLLVASGQSEEYRRFCTEMIGRNGQVRGARAAFLAGVCCKLGPGALADYTPALTMIRSAISQSPANSAFLLLQAQLLVRAGQTQTAADELQKLMITANPSELSYPLVRLHLAMANRQLGRSDDSKRLLRESTVWIEKNNLESLPAGADLTQPLSWAMRLQLKLLRDEVEATLR